MPWVGDNEVMYWASLLHFYQPPGQLHDVLRRVCDESYRPLIDVFRRHRNACVTVNINGVLTEMLWENGFQDVIDGLGELAARGQVEFVGSGQFHPILPLISEDERRRQIARNHVVNRHFFGDVYQPRGFFPPEMCFSSDIVDSIVAQGYQWVLVSGVACPVAWPMDVIHQVAGSEGSLSVFFRDDVLSNKVSFQSLDGPGFIGHLRDLGSSEDGDVYVVTAQDAETFGHHIKDWETVFLAEVYEALAEEQPLAALAGSRPTRQTAAGQHSALLDFQAERESEIQAVTLSQLLDKFPTGQVVEPKASSWSTTAEDIDAGNPYPLWNSPDNEVHRLQWEHLLICQELLRQAQQHADSEDSRSFARIARSLMDRAEHSCQFWWASRRPMWDVNMIHRGLMQQEQVILNAFRAVALSQATPEVRRESYYRVLAARDVRAKIVDQLFL